MRQQQKTFALWIVIFLMTAFIVKMISDNNQNRKSITYPQFIKAIENKHISDVTFKGKNNIYGRFKKTYENGKKFHLIGDTGDNSFKILRKHGITPKYEEEEQNFFSSLLISWGPIILLIVIFWFFLRQIQIGGGKAMNFAKSKARMLSPNDIKVTFSDVAGVEEAKEELKEIVDFLKAPKKYTKLGGKIPKGVILIGQPGTGKTLLARAVAGEADVPFFSISGSDFVEMFVGVGASRVRDLFEQGKKHAPCIIFIDEIDAVGRHRGASYGGGHDEREQTLNQLLVEMDGFQSNEGVILIAATNRIDVLDPALLRAGRFDRRVNVGAPDVRGRLGILKVHTKKNPLDKDIDLEVLARGTPGFTGADIANMVNEAALNAARLGKSALDMNDFETAKDKVLMGPERKSMVISDQEKKVTAFHEAGHTLVGINLPHTDPIHKVSIMPRGGALGVTQTLPEEDRLNLTREKGQNFIAFLMGGRCAEEIVFNEITSGASNDIEKATELARNMICSWGMSDKMGPVNYHSQSGPYNLKDKDANCSEKTREDIDKEIHNIIDTNYKLATKILKDNRDVLDRIANALIIWETLDSSQVKKIIAGEDIGKPILTTSKPKKKKQIKENVEISKEGEKLNKSKSSDPVIA